MSARERILGTLCSAIVVLVSGCLSVPEESKEMSRPENLTRKVLYEATFSLTLSDNEPSTFGVMTATWDIGLKAIALSVKNNTKGTMKILWDSCAFQDIAGKSSRVIHSGVRLIDRNASQAPSIIMSGGSFQDTIVPTANIIYISNWMYLNLYPMETSDNKGLLDSECQEVIASAAPIRVLLTVECGGEVKEFVFTFKPTSYTIKDSVI